MAEPEQANQPLHSDDSECLFANPAHAAPRTLLAALRIRRTHCCGHSGARWRHRASRAREVTPGQALRNSACCSYPVGPEVLRPRLLLPSVLARSARAVGYAESRQASD
jgi:hypothetical protein